MEFTIFLFIMCLILTVANYRSGDYLFAVLVSFAMGINFALLMQAFK